METFNCERLHFLVCSSLFSMNQSCDSLNPRDKNIPDPTPTMIPYIMLIKTFNVVYILIVCISSFKCKTCFAIYAMDWQFTPLPTTRCTTFLLRFVWPLKVIMTSILAALRCLTTMMVFFPVCMLTFRNYSLFKGRGTTLTVKLICFAVFLCQNPARVKLCEALHERLDDK